MQTNLCLHLLLSHTETPPFLGCQMQMPNWEVSGPHHPWSSLQFPRCQWHLSEHQCLYFWCNQWVDDGSSPLDCPSSWGLGVCPPRHSSQTWARPSAPQRVAPKADQPGAWCPAHSAHPLAGPSLWRQAAQISTNSASCFVDLNAPKNLVAEYISYYYHYWLHLFWS